VRVVDKEPFGRLSWWEYTAQVLKEKGVDEGMIGVEEDVCVISTFRKLQSVLPKAQFKGADEIFQLARIIKVPEEIEIIKQSILINLKDVERTKELIKHHIKAGKEYIFSSIFS
jgi:Xaa-Pro aminopeptidase